ncbi:hypothetical protein SAMN04488018_10599 [Myroides marinus]|uniref:Membrane protein insertion efficiency factor YidD n=1 Tax=Myroides marinus TaxID=703342 RepID=A0A1H6TQR7_9FLAO|nr:hypothetical protein SAMN04488018_10599 [Myroides marinus]
MKYILLFIIKSYWLLIPPKNRRKCIFKKSCSQAVYEDTTTNGFIAGFKTLLFRFKSCNNQYDIITDYTTNKKKLLLKNGVILPENEIAKRLL